MSDNILHMQKTPTIRELMGLDEDVFAEQRAVPEAPHLPEVIEEEAQKTEVLTMPRKKRFFSRDFVRYPLVFAIAFGIFYLVINFSAVLQQIRGIKVLPEKKQSEVVLGATTPDFDKWIRKYIVYTSNEQILGPNEDPDRDSLTNMDEYKIGTNPFNVDTDSDGAADGIEVLGGSNPLYSGSQTQVQHSVIEQNLDLSIIESRRDFLPEAGDFAIDISKPGLIEIPKIEVNAQVAWTQDFSKMEEDLKYGAAHHPATPYPGQRGTASIHGHSSGNPWDGNFKTLFTKLNFLAAGDEIFVTEYSADGSSRRYRFIVRSAAVYAKDDPAQFADLGGYFLNVSTSWPIGTARQRYVVTTELAGL